MSKPPTASKGKAIQVRCYQRTLGMALALLALTWPISPALAQSEIELKVKSAFLFNFAKFTTWPTGPFAPSAPFVIGSFSDPEFMEVLEATLAGKTLGARPIVVRRITEEDDLRGCQILFIGHAQDEKAKALIKRAIAAHVLTVGENDDFTNRGGMIRFVVSDGSVRFAINQQQAEEAGLRLSSKLLELAVNERKGGG